VAGNQPNDHALIKENLNACKVGKKTVSAQQYVLLPLWSIGSQDPHNTDDDVSFDVKENEHDVHVSLSGSDKTDNKKHDDKAKRDDKGKSPIDSPTRVWDLRAEFKEFSSNSTNRVNVVNAPVTAAGPNSTNSTNSFNTASPSVNDISPNFGIARKSSFVDPSKYPNDPNMPELEDIVYLDYEKDVGAEADLSNFETHIRVSPIPTTRVWVLVDLPKGKRAIGSKWVFRNKKDERGIVIRNKARLVAQGHTQEEGIDYDEVFDLVARIEAIRLFLAYASLMGLMVYQMNVKSAFLYETIKEEVYICQPPGFKDPDYPDKTLFIKKQKGDILIVQVYVDDIIFGSTNKELCKAFEKLIKDKFQMSFMGELTFFLGLKVKRNDDEIFISQDKYIAEILRKFGFTDVKSASTLIDTDKPLLKDPDGEDVDVHIYRSMIGSLMYLTSSRPDSMFAVCACTRLQVTPKVSHFHAVKRIFSDYAGASLDRKSTTGGCQFLEYDQSTSMDCPIFLNDNEDHPVQNKESSENSPEENVVSKTNQEPPQDSNMHQLIEECSIEFLEEQKQNMEKTMLDLIKLFAPILSTKEPKNSLSMGYEHLSITPETESDEVTKSNAKNLLPIPSECEVTSEDKKECDELVCNTFSDFKIVDDISVYDDDFEDIEYVEASLPDPEIDNSSISRPPPEPPDDNFDLEPEVISAVMEVIDELDEHFNPRGEIFVSIKIGDDDYFPFMFVI
nr:retrovirus-related Pol polyprotein from transposon TNT 1-94 [Tanacetum cinerariifolium]